MKFSYCFILISWMFGNGCVMAQAIKPSAKNATLQTVNLYKNLHALKGKAVMFGHQDALAYGVNWRYEEGRSDIKDVTGDYPAVYGWDIGGIEMGNENNLDDVPFKKMKAYIKQVYERGGVNTISWHPRSPIGAEKGSWDTTKGTVTGILPGGVNHNLYKDWLDKAATFFKSLKGKDGELIPILFRPYHEHTGNWFWWCKNVATDAEYKTLWRFTVYYLQDVKKVNNLLWVYSTAGDVKTETEFLERYPGDDVVDMLGFDAYQYDDPATSNSFLTNVDNLLGIVSKIAKDKNKLHALTETGYEAIPYPTWWTGVLWKAMEKHDASYVLVWRNHGWKKWENKMHYYAPYKGQASEKDFLVFYNLDKAFFQKAVTEQSLYK